MADTLDLDKLAAALSEASPCGDDLVYDARFIELEQAAAGKPETQFGPGEPPDWQKVDELALELAGQTRDVRLAVLLARAGARRRGLQGYAEALALLQALLERHWDRVHPQLDETDGNDPTMRLFALAPLASDLAGLGDLRAAAVAPVRGSLTVRDLELGLGLAAPTGDEVQPTEEGVLYALQTLMEAHPGIGAAFDTADRALQGVLATIDERAPGATGPDLQPLATLLRALARAAQRAAGGAAEGDAAAPAEADDAPAGGAAATAVGSIRTRADAVKALERVAEWIERNEPSHPAPLLIRRAQRLMAMNFIEIMRELAPEGLGQVGTITGVDTSS